jgi:hypothetical protein
MAFTIPASWTRQADLEIAPGRPIVATGSHDLATLNQRINMAMASHVRILAQGRVSVDRYHDESGVTVLAQRYLGAAHVWRDPVRCRVAVFGQKVDVLVQLGGVTVATVACGATAGWYYSSVVDVTGMTISSGTALVSVSAKQNSIVGSRFWYHWLLEEQPMTSLPAAGDSYTDFSRVDDAVFAADTPLDGYLLQRLAGNADECLRRRTRGLALIHPLADSPTLSSGWWRSDGPYILDVEPWVDRAAVAVYASAADQDVEVTAFSEWEDFDTAIARAQTLTAGAGASTLRFTGLRCRSDENSYTQNRFWVALKCANGGPVAYSPISVSTMRTTAKRDIIVSDPAGTELPSVEPVDWPTGRLVLGETQMLGYTSGDKGSLSQSAQYAEFDLATNATRPDANDEGQILLAANNRDAQRAEWLTELSVYELGTLTLRSVSIVGARARAGLDDASLQKAASVGELPPWSVVADVVRCANMFAAYATPQLAIRHIGQQWAFGNRTSGGNTIHQRGRYVFVPTQASAVTVDQVPVPAWVVAGSGLDPAKMRVRLLFALYHVGSNTDETPFDVEVKAGATVLGSTEAADTPAGVTAEEPLVSRWDAGLACIAVGRDATDFYEHAYVQQLGHLGRGEEFERPGAVGGRRVWAECEVIADLPSSAAVDIVVSCAFSNLWICLVGMSVDLVKRT